MSESPLSLPGQGIQPDMVRFPHFETKRTSPLLRQIDEKYAIAFCRHTERQMINPRSFTPFET